MKQLRAILDAVANNPTLVESLLNDGAWIPLAAYCRWYRESEGAVYSRRNKGVWQDGTHTRKIPGAGVWINLVEVNKWAAKRASPKASIRAVGRSDSLSPSAASPAANDSPSSRPRRTSATP